MGHHLLLASQRPVQGRAINAECSRDFADRDLPTRQQFASVREPLAAEFGFAPPVAPSSSRSSQTGLSALADQIASRDGYQWHKKPGSYSDRRVGCQTASAMIPPRAMASA